MVQDSPSAPIVASDAMGVIPRLRSTRRDMLRIGGVAAALSSLGASKDAEAAWGGTSAEWKLLNRATYGPDPTQIALMNSLGYDQYLEYQLNWESIVDPEVTERLSTFTTLGMQPYELYQQPSTSTIINELTDATLIRRIFSLRQLYEKVVEFWTDHFNINILDSLCQYLKTVDDREVIRPHALGTFPAMLRASAHSPAMLVYLDNNTNRRGNPNENYARELMELHTLGVNGGYSQQDVVEVARCFTGWTLYGTGAGANAGRFLFSASNHDQGAKTVLGNQVPANGGITDGETVLTILINHPSTARFIATKLCKYFWGENPPQALINEVAAIYSSTQGDIKSMIRRILSRDWLSIAPPKFKRPAHLAASAIRATQVGVTTVANLRGSWIAPTGHLPFRWPPPDGYPDTFDFWSGLLLGRWNIAFGLTSSQIGGTTINLSYLTGGSTNAAAIAARINQLVFNGTLDQKSLNTLTYYMLPNPVTATRARDAWGLAMSLPMFQYH